MRHVNELANFKQTNSEPAVARTANSTYKKLAAQWLNDLGYYFALGSETGRQLSALKSATFFSCKPLCALFE